MNGVTLIQLLQQLAPEEWQCKWDNSGLLVGSARKDVKKVLVTVDVTNTVIDYAIAIGADWIVSHHPMIFSGIKQVTDENPVGSKVLRLVEHGINLYSMHTNFDASDGGMGVMAAKKLGLQSVSPLGDVEERMSEDGYEVTIGIGAEGMLEEPVPLGTFISRLKEIFGMDGVRLFCTPGQYNKMVSHVALCPGSGKDYLARAKQVHADVYVTGDITHHVGLDAVDLEGMCVIDCGHYQMEWIFVEIVAKYLREVLGDEVEILEDEYRPAYKSL